MNTIPAVGSICGRCVGKGWCWGEDEYGIEWDGEQVPCPYYMVEAVRVSDGTVTLFGLECDEGRIAAWSETEGAYLARVRTEEADTTK